MDRAYTCRSHPENDRDRRASASDDRRDHDASLRIDCTFVDQTSFPEQRIDGCAHSDPDRPAHRHSRESEFTLRKDAAAEERALR